MQVLDAIPLWAQLGAGALLLIALIVGAGTKRFGRLWVFGWVFDREVDDHAADVAEAKAETREWKQMYFRAVGVTIDTLEVAKKHTTLTPDESDQVRRLLADAAEGHPVARRPSRRDE